MPGRRLHCRHCGHFWHKRVWLPKFCPVCHCDDWHKTHPKGHVKDWKAKHEATPLTLAT